MTGPETNPAAPQPKELTGRIGKYQILKPLGKGAMGIVYLAHDTVLERDVALKVMVANIADDPELKQRFEREAKAVARMTHPNVVNVFDLGSHIDGSPFIAMELLKGQDLQKAMRTPPPMALERKVNTILQTLAGLAHAHQAAIVHRDIKPANIFLNHDGTVKIMDFGVARLTTASMTGTGNIVGTADYMSPEQVKGAKVDGRSDLFSVGCMLYELLAGRRPFHSDNLMAIFYKITHEEPNFDLIPQGAEHDALMPILKRALAKNLEDRYQSAYEFSNDLKEYLKLNATGPAAEHGLEGLVDIEPPRTAPALPGTDFSGPTVVTGDETAGGAPGGRSLAATQPRPGTTQQARPGTGVRLGGTAAGPATVTRQAATPTVLQRDPSVAPPRSARPVPGARLAPPPSRAPMIIGGVVVVAALAAGGYFALRGGPPPPTLPPTTEAAAPSTTLPPPPTTLGAPPTTAPPPTFVVTEGKGAVAMRAAQAAFKQGDYDRALAHAQRALGEDPVSADAKRLAENALGGQQAATRFRAADAALRAGEYDKAQAEVDAGRGLAPWDARGPQLVSRIQEAQQQARLRAEQQRQAQVAQQLNTYISQADGALAGQKYDAAIALYDEALKLDGSNQRALSGKSSAVQARALSAAAAGAGGGVAVRPAGRSFSSGKTVAQSGETQGGNVPAGFEDTPGVLVKKGSTAAELPGKVQFDVQPDTPKAGEKYTVKIYLVNEGNAPISLKDMVITTIINGKKVGFPVPPQTREVAPQQKGMLLDTAEVWREATTSWSMEVRVSTARGERYTNTLSWK